MSIGIVGVCDYQLSRRRPGLLRTVIAETQAVAGSARRQHSREELRFGSDLTDGR